MTLAKVLGADLVSIISLLPPVARRKEDGGQRDATEHYQNRKKLGCAEGEDVAKQTTYSKLEILELILSELGIPARQDPWQSTFSRWWPRDSSARHNFIWTDRSGRVSLWLIQTPFFDSVVSARRGLMFLECVELCKWAMCQSMYHLLSPGVALSFHSFLLCQFGNCSWSMTLQTSSWARRWTKCAMTAFLASCRSMRGALGGCIFFMATAVASNS